MAITFSTYFHVLEGIEALGYTFEMAQKDPMTGRWSGTPEPEILDRMLQKTMGAGYAYAGQSHPNDQDDKEVGNILLAAACVGTKPVCMVMTGMLAPDENEIERVLVQHMLAHGRRVRPDFEVKSCADIPGFKVWSLVGGKAAVEELHQLFKFQFEMGAQTAPELEDMTPEEKIQWIKDVVAGSRKCNNAGDASYACAPLHRRIGQLFGYDPAAIEDHISKNASLPHVPNLPHYTGVPAAMKPHLGPPIDKLGPYHHEWYDPYLHMLIYEGFIYVPGLSRRRP